MSEISHVAIIMDGNGRWGLKKFNSRNFGHRKGIKTVGSDTSLIITEIDHLADLVAKFASTDQNPVGGPAIRFVSKDSGTPG